MAATEKPSHHIQYFETTSLWDETQLLTLMPASSVIVVFKSTDPIADFAGIHKKLNSISTKCHQCTVNAILFQVNDTF